MNTAPAATFREDLAQVCKRWSKTTGYGTPDFGLSFFLSNLLGIKDHTDQLFDGMPHNLNINYTSEKVVADSPYMGDDMGYFGATSADEEAHLAACSPSIDSTKT